VLVNFLFVNPRFSTWLMVNSKLFTMFDGYLTWTQKKMGPKVTEEPHGEAPRLASGCVPGSMKNRKWVIRCNKPFMQINGLILIMAYI